MTKKHRCPVITGGTNGHQEKVSAFWVIDLEGHGKCQRYREGRCELSSGECPYSGERTFELAFRWENIFAEKYYTGGLRGHRGPGVRI